MAGVARRIDRRGLSSSPREEIAEHQGPLAVRNQIAQRSNGACQSITRTVGCFAHLAFLTETIVCVGFVVAAADLPNDLIWTDMRYFYTSSYYVYIAANRRLFWQNRSSSHTSADNPSHEFPTLAASTALPTVISKTATITTPLMKSVRISLTALCERLRYICANQLR